MPSTTCKMALIQFAINIGNHRSHCVHLYGMLDNRISYVRNSRKNCEGSVSGSYMYVIFQLDRIDINKDKNYL